MNLYSWLSDVQADKSWLLVIAPDVSGELWKAKNLIYYLILLLERRGDGNMTCLKGACMNSIRSRSIKVICELQIINLWQPVNTYQGPNILDSERDLIRQLR